VSYVVLITNRREEKKHVLNFCPPQRLNDAMTTNDDNDNHVIVILNLHPNFPRVDDDRNLIFNRPSTGLLRGC
jgi:hypothetical protein